MIWLQVQHGDRGKFLTLFHLFLCWTYCEHDIQGRQPLPRK